MPWSALVNTNYTEILFGHWDALIFLAAVPLIFILGRFLLGLYFYAHFRDFNMRRELVEADNKAVSVALVGLQAGLALTAWGALYDQDVDNYSRNILGGFVWFFIGLVFMGIFFVFTDKFTLRSARITEGTKDGNIAASLCVASNFVSSGIVSLYTIGGGVDRWDEAFGSACIFFVLCRLFLSISHFGVVFIFRRFGDLEEEIRNGNPAAGVLLFMMQSGIAIFVTNPMRSSEEILAFFVWCVIGTLAIVVIDLLMWFVIVTRDGKQEFAEKRWGGVFVEGCGVIAASLAVIPFLPNECAYTAQLTQSFSERLFSTGTTEKLFQWPNLFYFSIVVCYLCGAKLLYVLPSLFTVRPNLWRYVLRFFLATPGDLPEIAAKETVSAAFLDEDSSAEFTSYASLNAAGKARGRKNHLRSEASSGVYTTGDMNIASAPREGGGGGGEGAADNDALAAQVSSSAYLAPQKYRGPKTRGGAVDADVVGSDSQTSNARGAAARSPSHFVAELSESAEPTIDFSAYAAKEGLSRSDFDSTVRISEARAVTFGGLLLSVGYLLRSSFATTIGSSRLENYEVVLYTLFWVGVCTLTFMVGIVIQSYILWRRFSPPSRTNLASGIVQFALLIAVAMQAGSSIMANQEDGPFDLSTDLSEALFIFLIQMILIGMSGFVFQFFTSYDDQAAVAEGNTAAAVANAGVLITSSLLASAPTTKTSELAAFAAFFVIGSVLTHFSAYFITRRLIFGGASADEAITKDRNWGVAAVEAVVGIGTAYAYSALLPELCGAKSDGGAPSYNQTFVNATGWDGY